MRARDNEVSCPPSGLIIALGYYAGDEAAAMRLARLLADIEPRRRSDVTLALCRRFDVELSPLAWQTQLHCGHKFGTMALRSEREAVGHPDGCNGLWAGIMDKLAESWATGRLNAHSVLFLEADGCPLRRDWIDRLIAEHTRTLAAGKRVTGHLMEVTDYPHLNGTMALHLSMWADHPSLHFTPPGGAWDMHHAAVLAAAARPTRLISNFYGSRDWTPGALAAVAKETAWLASVKDDSALRWAEQNLVAGSAPAKE